MSDDTPKRKKAEEPQDPDAFMTQAREALQTQREAAQAKLQAAQDELDAIDAKLDRIEAYFNPRPAAATMEPKARKPRAPATGTRKPRQSGVRDNVLSEIAKHQDGISRKDLLAAMNATDKAAEQSISNAVSALKKDGKISGEQGHYKAV
jgi:Skp family chaperone for outer membrane proteins